MNRNQRRQTTTSSTGQNPANGQTASNTNYHSIYQSQFTRNTRSNSEARARPQTTSGHNSLIQTQPNLQNANNYGSSQLNMKNSQQIAQQIYQNSTSYGQNMYKGIRPSHMLETNHKNIRLNSATNANRDGHYIKQGSGPSQINQYQQNSKIGQGSTMMGPGSLSYQKVSNSATNLKFSENRAQSSGGSIQLSNTAHSSALKYSIQQSNYPQQNQYYKTSSQNQIRNGSIRKDGSSTSQLQNGGQYPLYAQNQAVRDNMHKGAQANSLQKFSQRPQSSSSQQVQANLTEQSTNLKTRIGSMRAGPTGSVNFLQQKQKSDGKGGGPNLTKTNENQNQNDSMARKAQQKHNIQLLQKNLQYLSEKQKRQQQQQNDASSHKNADNKGSSSQQLQIAANINESKSHRLVSLKSGGNGPAGSQINQILQEKKQLYIKQKISQGGNNTKISKPLKSPKLNNLMSGDGISQNPANENQQKDQMTEKQKMLMRMSYNSGAMNQYSQQQQTAHTTKNTSQKFQFQDTGSLSQQRGSVRGSGLPPSSASQQSIINSVMSQHKKFGSNDAKAQKDSSTSAMKTRHMIGPNSTSSQPGGLMNQTLTQKVDSKQNQKQGSSKKKIKFHLSSQQQDQGRDHSSNLPFNKLLGENYQREVRSHSLSKNQGMRSSSQNPILDDKESGPLPVSASHNHLGINVRASQQNTGSSQNRQNFFQRETRESSNAAPRSESTNILNFNEKINMQRRSQQNFLNSSHSMINTNRGVIPPSIPTAPSHKSSLDQTKTPSAIQGQKSSPGILVVQNLQQVYLGDINNPKYIGRTNLDVKTLFKQNSHQVSSQIKVDSVSGLNQKIQQFTTLDVNKMIHETSADEESEGQKLALQPGARIIIPNKEPTKCSIKRNGIVRAYSAITNQGLVRNYNEDRVSIILNITKPANRKDENWPKCSFFGVYDGHGGHTCAEFLRDQLHHFVIKQDCFPQDPKEAITRGFKQAEETFIQMCQGRDENGNPIVIDRSGSCAIVILIVGDTCFSANVGDSRAIISINGGQMVMPLSRDHKPSDVQEYQRIISNGGQVYQTSTSQTLEGNSQNKTKGAISKKENEPEYIIGPIRVLPGRLSVSRTFGDPEAKLSYRGGNMNVVKAEPDILQFQIQKNHDFMILASDGVFDKMSNEDISKCVWESCDKNKWQTTNGPNFKPAQTVHQQSGLAVESVLKNSLYRQSLDNVTVVMIAFQNFKRKVFGKSEKSDREERAQQAEESSSAVTTQKGSIVQTSSQFNPIDIYKSVDNLRSQISSNKINLPNRSDSISKSHESQDLSRLRQSGYSQQRMKQTHAGNPNNFIDNYSQTQANQQQQRNNYGGIQLQNQGAQISNKTAAHQSFSSTHSAGGFPTSSPLSSHQKQFQKPPMSGVTAVYQPVTPGNYAQSQQQLQQNNGMNPDQQTQMNNYYNRSTNNNQAVDSKKYGSYVSSNADNSQMRHSSGFTKQKYDNQKQNQERERALSAHSHASNRSQGQHSNNQTNQSIQRYQNHDMYYQRNNNQTPVYNYQQFHQGGHKQLQKPQIQSGYGGQYNTTGSTGQSVDSKRSSMHGPMSAGHDQPRRGSQQHMNVTTSQNFFNQQQQQNSRGSSRHSSQPRASVSQHHLFTYENQSPTTYLHQQPSSQPIGPGPSGVSTSGSVAASPLMSHSQSHKNINSGSKQQQTPQQQINQRSHKQLQLYEPNSLL